MASPPGSRVSPPTWLAVIWGILMVALGVVLLYPLVVLMAFGCDSGWQGCESAASVSMVLYGLIAGACILALMIWAIRAASTGKRIAAALLMPIGLLLGLLGAVGYYFSMALSAPGGS